MTPRRVLIGPSTFGAVDAEPVRRLEASGFDVVRNPHGRKLTRAELLALLPGVSGLIAGLEPLTREVLEGSELRVISRCGAGLSTVDLRAAAALGITVLNTPDAPTVAVAELTVGMMIALLRHVSQMDRAGHEGRWEKRIGRQLSGRSVLIVGFGRIGRKVAELLRPFGVRLLVTDRHVTSEADGAREVSLADGLRVADIVTVHASGDAQILGASEFRLLRPGALVLNAARGGVVDEAALCLALDEGVVAGAWVDTFVEEPYRGSLARYPQVILTPHVGSGTAECRQRMEMEAVENLLRAFAVTG